MLSQVSVTQRDVASACNVHPSTICLALKNAPSIPAATRTRIQGIARAMGYAPNAAARNLAFLRSEKNHVGGSLPLAWLNQEPRRDYWRSDPDANRVFVAAKTRAAQLGYALTDIWAAEPGLRLERLTQILHARGIEGVVFPVARIFDRAMMQPAWESFATVALGDYRPGDWVDTVCADYYSNMETVLIALTDRGHEQVGFVFDERWDATSGGLARSRYLSHQSDRPAHERVAACRIEAGPAAAEIVANWWAETRVTSVVCGGRITASIASVVLPPEVSIVALQAGEGDGEAMDERDEVVATSAIDHVVAKLQARDKRFGADARRSLIKGQWRGPAQVVAMNELLLAAGS